MVGDGLVPRRPETALCLVDVGAARLPPLVPRLLDREEEGVGAAEGAPDAVIVVLPRLGALPGLHVAPLPREVWRATLVVDGDAVNASRAVCDARRPPRGRAPSAHSK